NIDFELKKDASRFEGGSYNIPGIVGMGASLSLFEEVGVPTICDRVKSITDLLVQRLQDVGAEVISSREGETWSGIVSFNVPAKDLEAIHKQCKARNV